MTLSYYLISVPYETYLLQEAYGDRTFNFAFYRFTV